MIESLGLNISFFVRPLFDFLLFLFALKDIFIKFYLLKLIWVRFMMLCLVHLFLNLTNDGWDFDDVIKASYPHFSLNIRAGVKLKHSTLCLQKKWKFELLRAIFLHLNLLLLLRSWHLLHLTKTNGLELLEGNILRYFHDCLLETDLEIPSRVNLLLE